MAEYEPNGQKNTSYSEMSEFSEIGHFGGSFKRKHISVKQQDLTKSLAGLAKGLAVAAAGIVIVQSSIAMDDPAGFMEDFNAGIGDNRSPSSFQEMIVAGEEHVFDEEGTVIKEASCKETGIMRFVCKICGLEKDEEIPLADHTPSEEEGVEATCTEAGHTGHLVCSVCGEDLGEGEEIAALGHDWGAETVVRSATCTQTGIMRKTCQRCGETEDRVVAALGHSPGEEVAVIEASCTEGGISEIRCTRCGEVVNRVETAALGHNWGEEIVMDDATCTADGSMGHFCTVCEEFEETAVIPALGHQAAEAPVVTAATCTEAGVSEIVCERCGEVLEQTEIAALGHDWGEVIVITEATCEHEGSSKQVCSRCGEEQYMVELMLEHYDGDADYKCDRCGKALLSLYIASGSNSDGVYVGNFTIYPEINTAQPNESVGVSA
ncbi:MAG: hypothetical protein J5528_02080 [Firmicutes bacterium]|nr:hypothetical protein [Bacillota bacterium]